MDRLWTIEEAQHRLDDVIDAALSAPQIITENDTPTAVILSLAEYRHLRTHEGTLSDFFRRSPLAEAPIDLTRDTSPLDDDLSL